MADLTITAASVVSGADAVNVTGVAGETITAGMAVAKAADGTIWKCDNNSATALIRKPVGIALHASLANQPITYQTKGDITIGATVAAGVTYFSSDTAGGIGVAADNASGEYTGVLGVGKSTTQITLEIQYLGVAVA